MNEFTSISQSELKVFEFLDDIEVVFDVGTRTDIDYLKIKPNVVYHLFEPNLEFFSILAAKIQNENFKNVYLNNYGLGDEIGEFHYNPILETFRDNNSVFKLLLVKTIDWYVKEHNIDKIDFLKIDTEGWDLKVILGAKEIWPKIKYIQYEHWANDEKFHDLLKDDFDIKSIGYRNSLCLNKKLVNEKKRKEVLKFIKTNGFAELI